MLRIFLGRPLRVEGCRLAETVRACHAAFDGEPDLLVMFESLFSERGLSLDRLKVLIEVRDAGSIAQAAPGDPVRQSQYSRQLRELAEFFGCEVTERRGKLLKLTQQGERLAEMAREQLRSLDDFRAECRAEKTAFSIGAGDSLIQWLVIPRLGRVIDQFPDIRFATENLRTNEIVQQLTDCRLDFGIIRKSAVAPGLKCVSLGLIQYVAIAPKTLWGKRRGLTLRQFLTELPIAAQTTDGQFAGRLREIAQEFGSKFAPALASQSFPQTVAAIKSGRFAAIVPELALAEFPANSVKQVDDPAIALLAREAMLAWNPRLVRVRPHADRLAQSLPAVLKQ